MLQDYQIPNSDKLDMSRLWSLVKGKDPYVRPPKTRTYVEPRDWIEVLVAVGKDETATITLTKEAYQLLRQIFDNEE
jgi:hypothetical protein